MGAALVGPAIFAQRTRGTLEASAGGALGVAGACLLGPTAVASALAMHAVARAPWTSTFLAPFFVAPIGFAAFVAIGGALLAMRRQSWLDAVISGRERRYRIRAENEGDDDLPCLGPGPLVPSGVLEEVVFSPSPDPYRAPPEIVRPLVRIVR